MNTAYTVKQASKILNLSTNSVYKYLKTGDLKAIRTQPKGRFRIPQPSLEKFLGHKLSQSSALAPIASNNQPLLSPNSTLSPDLIPLNQPITDKSPKTIRFLLIFSLLLIILDLITTKSFSFLSQLIRIILAAIFIILAYQLNNFKKSK